MTTLNGPPNVYGKLPARGDFITRGFERAFIDPWDEWLRQVILASQESLAELWLDTYLTSPVWRFALSAGSCGPDTMLGVLIPSVDKVGRYFPLTLGCALAPGIELTGLITQASHWYRAAEALALAALEPEFSVDALAQPIALELAGTVMALPPAESVAPPGIYLPFAADAHSAAIRHAHQPLAQGLSLWWTTGSRRVAPCLLICPGLPPADSFAALLDGEWIRRGWTVPVEEQPDREAPAVADPGEEVGTEASESDTATKAAGQAADLAKRTDADDVRNPTETAGTREDLGSTEATIMGPGAAQRVGDRQQQS